MRHRSTVAFLLMVAAFFGACYWLAHDIGDNRVTLKEHSRTLDVICRSANETRAINDRDRLTLIRARDTALKNAADPKHKDVADLLREGAKNTQHEIDSRPYLEPIPDCLAPEPFPPRNP